jgi:hypothetical protein
MKIEGDAIGIGEKSSPFGQAHEPFMIRDKRAIALAGPTRCAHICVSFHVAAEQTVNRVNGESTGHYSLSLQVLHANSRTLRLIGDTKHCDYVLILGLGDELGKNSDIIKGALCIGNTHRPTENIDAAEFARMVPAILATGQGMKIEVDAQTVFTGPLDCLQEVAIN